MSDDHDALSRTATVFAGATASTAALLTLLGVNSERAWILLDDNRVRSWLVLATLAVVTALGSSIAVTSIDQTHQALRVGLLSVGAVAYVLALLASLGAASLGANAPTTPSIRELSATVADDGRSLILEFGITATRVDNDLGLIVTAMGPDGEELARSVVRPDDAGLVSHQTRIPVIEPAEGVITVKVWEAERDEPDCDDLDRRASCTRIRVPTGSSE